MSNETVKTNLPLTTVDYFSTVAPATMAFLEAMRLTYSLETSEDRKTKTYTCHGFITLLELEIFDGRIGKLITPSKEYLLGPISDMYVTDILKFKP